MTDTEILNAGIEMLRKEISQLQQLVDVMSDMDDEIGRDNYWTYKISMGEAEQILTWFQYKMHYRE